MSFEITPAHAEIFDAIMAKARNVVVEAVAGAGKTSTLLEAMRLIPSSEDVIFLAFNASIAKTLAERVPAHVEARTMNSLGNRAWARHMSRQRSARRHEVDADKLIKILNHWEDELRISRGQRLAYGGAALRLARLAKHNGLVVHDSGATGCSDGLIPDDIATWELLADEFDVDIPEKPDDALEHCANLARRLLAESTRTTNVIDFDDQIYLPFVYDVECYRYDRVFVDEAQDLSPLQHDLVARSLNAGGQLVAVGDPCQAIYHFRGADSSSMTNLERRFECVKLPLHVSYRCPKAVVAEAQKFVPHIRPHATAPDGHVDMKPVWHEKADLRGGDLVVCRTTAPVVDLAYTLIRKGVAAEVLGRDIGKNLEVLAKKCDKTGVVEDMLARLDDWEHTEVERALKRGNEVKAAQIEDRADTLRALCDGQTLVVVVLSLIETLSGDGGNSASKVTLSTVHKAKGLERDRVWILNRHLMPHKMAKKPAAIRQEGNITYVAVTRAKCELRSIIGPDGKGRPQ